MSATSYDGDPRVEVRAPRIIHVTDRWHVLRNDLGTWEAHDAVDDKTCWGMPVGWVSSSADPDDVIRQLIGDPQ